MSRRLRIDTTDGISIEYPEWRFNLRTSNTEPVVRLNVESRADVALMNEKTTELLHLLSGNKVRDLLTTIYRYRGFIWSSVKRDFQARYQTSMLGALWLVLQPLSMILVYTLVFPR